MDNERTIKSEKAFDGKILSVRVDTVEQIGQRYSKREIVEHIGGVGIVAVTDNDEVILVKQFRKAVEKFLYELPAGMLEPDEAPIKAATRELKEETGYSAREIDFVTEFYSSPGFCTEKIHLFYARGLEEGEQNLDEFEDLEVIKVSCDEALRMIKLGEIVDAKTIIGLSMLQLFDKGENK